MLWMLSTTVRGLSPRLSLTHCDRPQLARLEIARSPDSITQPSSFRKGALYGNAGGSSDAIPENAVCIGDDDGELDRARVEGTQRQRTGRGNEGLPDGQATK